MSAPKPNTKPLTGKQWAVLIGIVCAIGFVWNLISPTPEDHCITEYNTMYVDRGSVHDMGQDAYVANCHASDKYIANLHLH